MSAGQLAVPAFGLRIRPRFRRRELGLLVVAAAALVAGNVSLGATQREAAARLAGDASQVQVLAPADAAILVAYLGILFAAHLALTIAGRRTDQILLPTVGMLGGIGLLLMERLPQTLAGSLGGLARTQLVWLALSFALITVLAVAVRNDAWLRRYKYTWAAFGVGLLLLVLVLGRDVNGARLGIAIGPFTGQPSELLKVILVVFLAGYLSENQSLLAEESTPFGPIRLPPLPYLAPMVAMWATALGIVVIEKDLGAGLPTIAGKPPIPALHTDFPFAALGEELGLVGILAILGLYLVVIERGLRIAAAAPDEFRSILAAGLSLVVGVQAFIIAAGNLKLVPLTGITLPFISYGGSSLLANGLVVGLLIALSDRGAELPPPVLKRGRLRRFVDRGAA